MPAAVRKTIITCAVTGAVHTPTMSEYLPITPQEIAESAIEAAEAGAAILHIHARDPQDGRPPPIPRSTARFFRSSLKRPMPLSISPQAPALI